MHSIVALHSHNLFPLLASAFALSITLLKEKQTVGNYSEEREMTRFSLCSVQQQENGSGFVTGDSWIALIHSYPEI